MALLYFELHYWERAFGALRGPHRGRSRCRLTSRGEGLVARNYKSSYSASARARLRSSLTCAFLVSYITLAQRFCTALILRLLAAQTSEGATTSDQFYQQLGSDDFFSELADVVEKESK